MRKFALALLILALLATSTLAGPLARVESPESTVESQIAVSQPFKHQPATKRAFFRTMLRDRIGRENRGDRKRLLRRVLADDDLQTIALAYADYLRRLESGGQRLEEEEDADGKFFRFFQWIIENQDAIIAFLEKIIALFEGISPEAVSFEQPDGTTNGETGGWRLENKTYSLTPNASPLSRLQILNDRCRAIWRAAGFTNTSSRS